MKKYIEKDFKETEIGKIPQDWEIKEIKEIGEFKGGVTSIKKEDYNFGTPFIMYKNVYQNSKIDTQNMQLMNVPKKDVEKLKCVWGDIFFTASSETRNEVAISSVLLDNVENLTFNGFCKRLRLNNFDILFPTFARYLFRSKIFRNEILKFVTGDIRFNISQNNLKKIKIPLPPLSEQKNIAKILGDLDAKIENNNEQNEIMEEIGKTIFKHWFVDFEYENYKTKGGKMIWNANLEKEIPENWEVGKLGDLIFEKKERIGNENIKVLSAIKEGELIKSEEYFKKQVFSKDTSKYKKVKKFDFAYNPARINIGSIGLLKYFEIGAVSPVYVVFSVRKNYHWFFEKFLNLKNTKKQIKLLCSGGVRQNLDFKAFKELDFLIPPENLILKFNNLYEKYFALIKHNQKENEILREMRDTLLPKLIKGEIRIK